MKRVILMDSEYCSMGRWISVIVANELGMKLYEGRDLVALVDDPTFTNDTLKAFDEKIADMSLEEVKADKEIYHIHELLSEAIKKAVANGPCIIHERAASLIIQGDDVLKLFLYNTNMEHRIPRAINDPFYDIKHLTKEEVIAFIHREDHKRRVYRDVLEGTSWGIKEKYDLCLDSDILSREKCAEILVEACKDVSLDLEECASIIKKAF